MCLTDSKDELLDILYGDETLCEDTDDVLGDHRTGYTDDLDCHVSEHVPLKSIFLLFQHLKTLA